MRPGLVVRDENHKVRRTAFCVQCPQRRCAVCSAAAILSQALSIGQDRVPIGEPGLMHFRIERHNLGTRIGSQHSGCNQSGDINTPHRCGASASIPGDRGSHRAGNVRADNYSACNLWCIGNSCLHRIVERITHRGRNFWCQRSRCCQKLVRHRLGFFDRLCIAQLRRNLVA